MRKSDLIAALLLASVVSGACGSGPLNAEPPPASQTPAVPAVPAGPDIQGMKVARQLGKVTVPIDVRYQVSGAVSKNQSVAVSLAFIPKVAGSDMRVEFPRSETVSVSETTEVMVKKADAASVHRHNLIVTPVKGNAGEVRAIVSMNVDEGRYAGIFVIPVGGAP
jgi:hypothetical protein